MDGKKELGNSVLSVQLDDYDDYHDDYDDDYDDIYMLACLSMYFIIFRKL